MQKKILVVDDEPEYVTLVKTRLEANPYQILTASDGPEALEKAKREKPDLIILDLMLPKMNGLEFLREIKKDEGLKQIPVVVFTSSKEERDKAESFKLGVAGYMVKPPSHEKFFETIRTIDLYWTLSETPD